MCANNYLFTWPFRSVWYGAQLTRLALQLLVTQVSVSSTVLPTPCSSLGAQVQDDIVQYKVTRLLASDS